MRDWRTTWPHALGWAAVSFAAYFLLANFGLRWATVSGAASPVFPAAGLAFAVLVLGGLRYWPIVFLGRLAAGLATGASLPLWVEGAIAAGNALAAVSGALIVHWTRTNPAFGRLRDILCFVGAAVSSAAIGAAVGLAALAVNLGLGMSQATITWLNWSTGNLGGSIVVAPLILVWARGGPWSRNRVWWLQLLFSTLAAALTAWWLFNPQAAAMPRSFFIIAVLLWAALACGVRGATIAMFWVSAIAVWGTTRGHGLFSTVAVIYDAEAMRFVLLQQFIGIAAFSTLVLAVVADERRGKDALARQAEERKHVEDALRDSEALLSAVIDALPVGVWVADPGGRVFRSNEAGRRIWQADGSTGSYERGEFKGWYADGGEVIGPGQWAMERAAKHGDVTIEEMLEIECFDGSRKTILNSAMPVKDADGRTIAVIGVCHDITQIKRAEREKQELLESERAARTEVERASRLKDEFLSTLSHELRTPLTAILGWLQILRRRAVIDDPDVSRGLAVIERNARVQAQLIEDMLDMGRIISGKVRLDIQSVDLHDVVSAAVASVAPSAQAKGIQLETVLNPTQGIVRGDPNRLQQVVWNLLSNAIKFTPKGGKVQVRLAQDQSQLEITVTDTGQGMHPDFIQHAFDRFRQADGSTTRQYGGLGLGLAIVKHLVELHGGTVRASSSGEGKGSTFVVELPITVHVSPDGDGKAIARDALPDGTSSPEHSELSGISVLFVDDTQDAREIVQHFLEERKARVRTAGSGAEALRMLEREQPDVLVSDIGMPEMDGYELIRRVRALSQHGKDLPAVALTSFARAEDRARALRAGFQAHLAKPVQLAELMAAIQSLLRGSSGQPHGT